MSVLEYIESSKSIIDGGKETLNNLDSKTKEWSRVQRESTNVEQLHNTTYEAITYLSKTLKEIHKALDSLTKLQETNAVQVGSEAALLSEQFKVMNSTLGLEKYITEISPAFSQTEFRFEEGNSDFEEDIPLDLSYDFHSTKKIGVPLDESMFDFTAMPTNSVANNKYSTVDSMKNQTTNNKKFNSDTVKKASRESLAELPASKNSTMVQEKKGQSLGRPQDTPISPPPVQQTMSPQVPIPQQIPQQIPVPAPPQTTPSPQVHIKKARVLYGYNATENDELTMKAGEFIDVLNEDMGDGWALGIAQGKKGLFPRSYVQMQ
eukprot:NODE_46_length_32145_cov_0.918711.p14 type:complete len:320 gc:universal NODE_46_length_32145_cov_0.918711:4428-5387(+)